MKFKRININTRDEFKRSEFNHFYHVVWRIIENSSLIHTKKREIAYEI